MRIEELLDESRGGLRRLSPAQAASAGDAVLVDIRGAEQRERDGVIPGAVVIPRNVLEWRCAPDSDWRDERSRSVSSMRSTNVPPAPRASNQLKSAVRALPTWS